MENRRALNQTIVLKSRPRGEPQLDNFAQKTEPVPSAGPGQLLYRTLYLSIDPYLRGRMNEGKSYIEPFAIGQSIVSGFVGEVIESHVPGFAPGALVTGMGPWAHFGVSDGKDLSLVPREIPPSTVLGVLGMPGLTAYAGLLDIGKVKNGETVVVSAAAGAVGSVVVQLAKLRQCRTIGIAGGQEKCAYVVKELGADACIDYRHENLRDALKQHCPNGVDVYFDNVGGEVLAAVLDNLADHARIALCGMISEYNATERRPGPSLFPLLVHKASIQGFIVFEHNDRFPAFQAEVVPLLKAGKFKYREDVLDGLEKAPEALLRILRGKNLGKQLVKVAEH